MPTRLSIIYRLGIQANTEAGVPPSMGFDFRKELIV